MRRVGGVLAVAALLLGVLLTGGPVAGAATPRTTQAAVDPEFVQLAVSTVSPSVVTPGTTSLTVSGRLRNTGDRDVRDLEVRLQRGAALTTATGLDDALGATPEATAALGAFTPVAAHLAPGASVDFSVSVPVGTTAGRGLDLAEPGVYPVLVNLNGQPDFGSTARLDSAHFLLPVRPVPDAGTTPAPAAPNPVPITVLWPVADEPRLVPVAPGAAPELTDDTLAASFAAGGRLDGLVRALGSARALDTTGALTTATCVAVDPDLLATAEAMTSPGGYRVRTGSGSTPGTGAAAAATWLDQLRTLVDGSCVLALPWAQADLDVAAQAGLAGLERTAVTSGRDEVARALGTDPLSGVTWPSTGTLSTAAATDLVGLDQHTVLLPVGAVTGEGTERVVRTDGGPGSGAGLGAVLADDTVARALAATGDEGVTTTSGSRGLGGFAGTGGTGGDRRALALQDATAALLGTTVLESTLRGGATPARLVVTPPQRWTVDATEAGALLATVRGLLGGSTPPATGAPLAAVVQAAATADTTVATIPPVTGSPTDTAVVAAVERGLDGFVAAAQTDVQARVQPSDLVAPLQQGLVRALSATGRGPSPDAVAGALTTMLSGVQLQDRSGVFTLASEQSPLLLVVRNPLPVAVDVRVEVTGPPGLQVQDIGVQQLPAGSSRQLVLPTSVGRTGQFAADVRLSTSTGLQLGVPSRVLVRSTAYGTATAAVAGGAAALLVLLVARRLWHRFRGQPDRADEGRGPA